MNRRLSSSCIFLLFELRLRLQFAATLLLQLRPRPLTKQSATCVYIFCTSPPSLTLCPSDFPSTTSFLFVILPHHPSFRGADESRHPTGFCPYLLCLAILQNAFLVAVDAKQDPFRLSAQLVALGSFAFARLNSFPAVVSTFFDQDKPFQVLVWLLLQHTVIASSAVSNSWFSIQALF